MALMSRNRWSALTLLVVLVLGALCLGTYFVLLALGRVDVAFWLFYPCIAFLLSIVILSTLSEGKE